MLKKILSGVLMISILMSIAGCTPAAKEKEQQAIKYTKEQIQENLAAKQEVFKITWAPDDSKVLYIEEGKPEDTGLDKAYLWKVGAEDPEFVRDVSPTTRGFAWSPDSQYFLISEKLGEGSVNSIVKTTTLAEGEYKIKSIAIPVWSPDSQALAFAYEQHDYGESWGSLEVYTLGEKESEYIWRAKNYLYKVESWDEEGNIGYTETYEGKETKKSIKNIRPSIAGVHLGDTKEQVRAALGNNYEETPPGEEMGHFPEKVYRWTYEEGYKIFIGEKSGEVLEIITSSPQAETNLGIKIGDRAEKVFDIYRNRYIEPESIHGGKLFGIFKVEGAAALFFVFDLEEGESLQDIKPDSQVESMILTYPGHLDDSF